MQRWELVQPEISVVLKSNNTSPLLSDTPANEDITLDHKVPVTLQIDLGAPVVERSEKSVSKTKKDESAAVQLTPVPLFEETSYHHPAVLDQPVTSKGNEQPNVNASEEPERFGKKLLDSMVGLSQLRLSPGNNNTIEKSSSFISSRLEDFKWVRVPQAVKQYNIHEYWQYLMYKYFFPSASLQINIPGGLRAQIMATNKFKGKSADKSSSELKTLYEELCHDVRKELWALMSASFTRFYSTPKFKVFAQNYSKTPLSRRSVIKLPEPTNIKI
ncbi:hypothetical protein RFI_11038 [Reticulomyxa filosa]|uniref:RGS domain-containing protein n=1 Tax=Reticulomyxa filosa TaxID=46433 RepID=X6NIF0_RETFI|nr:hypothetical protein RFI_11038 [Reticulomyxa filosa]|eukprot:ETO26100.1 hypothetical protein RFI_11038 [Reticulomyxa filosa]